MDQNDGDFVEELAIGKSDFKRLRDDGLYYVDKTELIARILGSRGKEVILFTRPRRFGKSLNMSMLDAFFNMKYKGNPWFRGLAIDGRKDLDEHRNAYPVIFLSMKDLDSDSIDSFRKRFARKVRNLFIEFKYIRESDMDDGLLEDFNRILSMEADAECLEDSLYLLCKVLHDYHGKSPILLIDEYDDPVTRSFGMDILDDIVKFLRRLYSPVLKDNPHLRFAVLTGVMQIAKESIFSGLNNLYVDNALSKGFSECFGFTESEVRRILEDAGHPEKFEECREWYDGYVFGDAEVYNPWSVIRYVDSGFVPGEYWGRTSDNSIIGVLMDLADEGTLDDLIILGGGGGIEGAGFAAVSIGDLMGGRDALLSVMTMAGYLSAAPNGSGYLLSIPNREVYGVFCDAILNRSGTVVQQQFRDLFKALREGDVAGVERNAFSILAENFKSIQLKDEGDYQLIIAGAAMAMLGRYRIAVEKEAGNGRADLIMTRNSPAVPNVVVEFKRGNSDDPESWLREAEEGLLQIKRKGYCHSLKGRTLMYGVCFRNKKARAVLEEAFL